MNKSVIWSLAIKNSISVICWTALAIVFNKWWIALFGLLFICGKTECKISDINSYCRVCDKCGKRSPYTDNYNKAIDKAKDAGWIHCVDGDKDYCPDCQ